MLTLPSTDPVAIKMGRRFRLGVYRTNEERKRKIVPKLIVSIPRDSVSLMAALSGESPRQSSQDCSSSISFLRKCSLVLSIQHNAVSVMTVSLPVECYRKAPAPCLGVYWAGEVCIHHSGSYSFSKQQALPGTPENFFAQQRQRGRVNKNPNSRDFLKNTQALRVIDDVCRNIKGNCWGSEENCPDYATLLPKHSRKRAMDDVDQ